MKQSTSFAQVATNLLNVLQGYTKSIRFVVVLSFLFTLSVGSMWGADGDVLYTLSFTTLSSGSNYNNYATAHTITVSNKTWSVTGNQSLGNFLGVGGKDGSNKDRVIYSTSQIGSKVVKKVIITNDGTGGNGTITLNSIKLEVASNSNFSTIVDTKTISSPTKSGQIEFIPTSPLTVWPENSYYRITYNYKNNSTSKNGYVKVNSVVFYEGATTPTCTNPTVSWTTAPASGNVGGSMTAKANTNYPTGLTYSSSDPSVATIDASGVIEYLKVGSTTITASVTGDGTTYCNETVSVSKTITVTCGSKVTINTTSDGNGTITINKTPIETCSDNYGDRQITITLNPNSHYSSNAPTISGVANATITGSGNTYTVQLPKSSNGTLNISATFKEDEKYTVTWSADGTPIKTQEVYVNEQVSEVPTSSDIPEENRCGDKFVGWTTAPIATPQNEAPDVFTTVAGSPTITKATTFYAVFADYEQ
jgi:hypothetical protein